MLLRTYGWYSNRHCREWVLDLIFDHRIFIFAHYSTLSLKITFPRAAGTCTRCPSEVRLFSSDCDWVCNISLRFDKGIHSGKQDNVRVVPFGKPIMDPSKVQSRLIQAQRAILNPNKSLDLFLNDSTCEVKDEVQFSESIICIDVKGRDVRDLSVVDLPGIIFNVGEGEDDRNPKLIRSLAKKEISRDNCVVLLCITMKGECPFQVHSSQ